MIKIRKNKKLLIWLGSIIGLSSMLVVSYLGIRSTINIKNKNKLLNNVKINRIKENSISELPNYNVATADMFYDTRNLKFHLGNAASGQQVTAYGWLGTYTKLTRQPRSNNEQFHNNTLVLTGWNGQVLWVNNDIKAKIYDTKYNFQTDEIYVVRGNDQSGSECMTLSIHDALTGQVKNSGIQIKSFRNDLNLMHNSYNWDNERQKQSGFQDFINLKDGTVIWYYQIDINRTKHKNDDEGVKTDFLYNNWSKITTMISIKKNNNTLQINNLSISFLGDNKPKNNGNNYLLTSPFLTVTKNNKMFFNWIQTNSASSNSIKGEHVYFEIKLKSNDIETDNQRLTNEVINDINLSNDLNFWSRNYLGDKIKDALTKPTRNMFDQNLISFPYSYAQKKENDTVPAYNVYNFYANETNSINNKSSNDNRISKNYNFGEQIYKYWKDNGIENKEENEIINGNNLLDFSPFPKSSKYDVFNRVIAVSPFDNTIIYAARPGYTLRSNDKVSDVFNGRIKYNWTFVSFWIANSHNAKSNDFYQNIIIPNNSLMGGGSISGYSYNVDPRFIKETNDIYNILTFDIRSFKRDASKKLKMSLYFPQTGSKANLEGKGLLKTSKIGILDLNGADEFTDNITTFRGSYYRAHNVLRFTKPIQGTNTFAYLTSQADLKKWYVRTWLNTNNGGNSFSDKQVLCSNSRNNQRLEALKLNSQLTGQYDVLDKADSIDLVSNYYNSPFKSTHAITWFPKISVIVDKNEEFDRKLKLEIEHIQNLNNGNDGQFIKHKKNFKEIVELTNVSTQIFTSLKDHVKIKSMKGNSDKILVEVDYGNFEKSKYGQKFGNVNNSTLNWATNNKNALRLELQIDPNPKNIKNLNLNIPSVFTKSYPIVSSNGETGFDKVLKKYIEWKTKNITKLINEKKAGEDGNGTVGLNSISIKAYLRLNSEASDNAYKEQTIYKINDNKFVLYGQNNKLAIYDDKYTGNRWIYNQSSTKYSDNNKFGWKNGDVKLLYKNSTLTSENINSDSKFKIVFKASDFDNDILKDSSNNNLLSIQYRDASTLKIDFKDNYLKNRFKIFNQMFGLKLKLEGMNNGKKTFELIKDFSDDDLCSLIGKNNNFLVSGVNSDIVKARFSLSKINNNDINNFIDTDLSYPENVLNSDKFRSKEYQINSTLISVDDALLSFSKLEFNNSYWNDLNVSSLASVFNSYKKNVIEKLSGTNKDKLDIEFSYDNENNYMNADKFSQHLLNKTKNYSDNNLGIVSFWNGKIDTKYSEKKIKAKFILKSDIVGKDNLTLHGKNNDRIEGYINTDNVITKLDISKYIEILEKEKTIVILDNSNGKLKNFTPPQIHGNLSEGFLHGRDFNTVTSALSKYGIITEYKKQDGNWTDKKSEIKTYNTSDPVIKLRFRIEDKNIVLKINDNELITSDNLQKTYVELKLNVPKVIKITDDLVDKFITKNWITGNTYKINIDTNIEKEFVDEIKKNNDGLVKKSGAFKNALLVIKYSLGNSNNFMIENEFKQYLLNSKINFKNNQIKIKIEIKNSTSSKEPEFILERNESKIIYQNGNNIIKKWIHGTEIEKQLDNIKVNGDSENLSYTFPNIIDKILKESQYEGIKICFSLNLNISINEDLLSNGDIRKNWVDKYPLKVHATEKIIKIKIQTISNEFIYGPKEDGTIKIHDIDLSKIKPIIKLDVNWLKQKLILSKGKYITDLSLLDITNYEEKVLSNIDERLKLLLTIKYNFNGKNNLDKNQLFIEIQNILKDYKKWPYGLLQLWDGNNLGYKIEAKFIAIQSNKYEIDSNDLKNYVDTSEIKTLIDVKSYINQLKNTKLNFEIGKELNSINELNFPNWLNTIKDDPLSNQSFNDVKEILNKLGISIQYRNDKVFNWVDDQKQLNSYNPNNPYLEIRLKLNNVKNVVVLVSNDEEIDSNTINDGDAGVSKPIKLNLNISTKIVVENKIINEFIEQFPVSGNTKYLNIDKSKENEFINKIKNNNSNEGVKKSNIYIEYQLGSSEWLVKDRLIEYLKLRNIDETTNEIKFRLKVKNTDVNNPDFAIDSTEKILLGKNISNSAKVKIYINKQNYEDNINSLFAVGNSDNYKISNLELLSNSLSDGLKIKLSINKNKNSNVTYYPDLPTLNIDKTLWLKLETQNGYIFELAEPPNKDSKWYSINTKGINSVVKLKSEWLEKIKLVGNTKNLIINEEEVFSEINNKKILSKNKNNLIKIRYTVDNVNWFDKHEFEKKLLELDGAKDQNNFIIKRDDIRAKFDVNRSYKENNFYILNIDDKNILEDKQNNLSKLLVSGSLNTDFKGYINIDKLSNFTVDNFKIKGTSNKPKILIKNFDNLNSLLNQYSTDNIFEIKFTTNLTPNKIPNYEIGHQLWNPGLGLIDRNKLIELGIKINSDRIFQIGFLTKNSSYQIYHNNKLYNGVYSLDISKNIDINIEIENPFESKNLKIGLWFRNKNKTPRFYQNKGGVRLTTIENNVNNYDKTVQDILEESNLSSDEKNALEFVYIVLDKIPDDELIRITSSEEINNYEVSSKWKKISSIDNDGFVNNLGLRVGQYIFVALRVKQEFAKRKNNSYSLKDDNHSVTDKNISRVNGYKINTSELEIDWKKMNLINTLNSLEKPLDGFSIINSLPIKKDENYNYLGVNLKLNIFNQFWLNENDEPIITHNKVKLVKRESVNSINKGNYVNDSGIEIKDKHGSSIPILVDNKGFPAKLITELKPTNSINLIELSSGVFTFKGSSVETSKFSLFRNQKIQIEYVPKTNKSNLNDKLQDYYFDNSNNNKTNYVLGNEIKYLLDNNKNITYKFDVSILDKLVYKNVNDLFDVPINGESKLITPIALERTENSHSSRIFTGIQELENMLKNDFGDLLKFQFKHIKSDGLIRVYEGIDVAKIGTLRNDDKIILNVVLNSEDLIFSKFIEPLVINVTGLLEKSPKSEQLQNLRVRQSGNINGKGTFKVLINNPDNDNSQNVLPGYKFALRVWDVNKVIKINWTTDQNIISDLSNGDKIEWKLVSDKNQSIVNSYYNTISNGTKQNNLGEIEYFFAKINSVGNNIPHIIDHQIGKIPIDNTVYPEKSGFVISGLKDVQDELFVITTDMFTNIMNELDPYYVGLNGYGIMKFNFLNNRVNVNDLYITNAGNIVDKSNHLLKMEQKQINSILEMKLVDFLKKIKFIAKRSDESSLNKFTKIEFRYSSNETNTSNKLFNDDLISAVFTNNDNSITLLSNFSKVKNLSLINDQNNSLWYILFGTVSIVTLGVFVLICFKLKNKKLN